MNISLKIPLLGISAILAMGLSPAQQKKNEPGITPVSHWNFDEARDWHNMAFPYATPVKIAQDYAGNNDLALINLDPIKAWASGRQFSGIRFDGKGQLLKGKKPINELKSTFSLSLWIKTNAPGSDSPSNAPALVGDKDGIIWGAINTEGKIIIAQGDTPIASSKESVNDDQWHHIVFLRQEESGNVVIYVDGKKSGQGKTTPGELPGEYLGFGAAKGGGTFQGVIDQIHLFGKVINDKSVAILRDNHAPKAYPLETLITSTKPSPTGSILHLYTFDPEQDTISVSKFGQGKTGKVEYNRDGTFTYTAGPNFKGTDRFPVTITDGRGGYCRTEMIVNDESTVPRIPVTKYVLNTELPSPPADDGETGHRPTVVLDWNNDGKPDILAAANNNIWVYLNESTKQNIKFSAPIAVKTGSESLSGTSLSYIPAAKNKIPTLVVRQKDGTLSLYDVKPGKNGASLSEKGTIKDTEGNDLKIPTNAFAFGDHDSDGKIDLLIGDGGGIYVHRNEGTPTSPRYAAKRENIIRNDYNLAPYFADINGDGIPDLLNGINWGSVHYKLGFKGKNIMDSPLNGEIMLTDEDGKTPMKGENTLLRQLNGTYGAFADLNGDGVIDMVLGGYGGGSLVVAWGTDPNSARNNLALIERIYKAHPRNLGQALDANDQELLKLYKNLNREWISWAVSLPSVDERERAYQDLKNHIKKFPFLKRKALDAWVKRDKSNNVTEVGPMHHVPGIFTMNWVTLHCLKPDTAKHRLDVANTLGLKGLDREQYLKSGVAVADNNKCTDGQMLSITDMMKYHPRILFPDDHISIDNHFGDGREAMSYVFRSNKNTFGNDVGDAASEMAQDLREPAERLLGKGSTIGDYFTLVMAHEVCHSLDAYVYGRANKDLSRRWFDMIIFAGNDGGDSPIIAQNESGWMDTEKTKELFKAKELWDGTSEWNTAWDDYWKNCPYKDLAFMRGNIGWFIGARQETLATQANHHWAGSESRIVGAMSRYERGHKSNINEVILYLDFLSAGLNKIPMYNFEVTQNPNRVAYKVDMTWLERNDKGHITKVTIGPRVYEFEVDETGRVTGMKSHPFPDVL